MTHIEQRIDSAAALASVNPVPHKGEAVHEEDTGRWKVGDGESAYNDLPYKMGVDSVAGRTGAVTLGVGDVAGAAPEASPTFTGTPKAPTRAASDNSTNLATTAFVRTAADAIVAGAPAALDNLDKIAAALNDDPAFASATATALGLKAPLESPTFTGTPKAPTRDVSDDSTNLATTAFVKAQPFAPATTFATWTNITPLLGGWVTFGAAYGAPRRTKINGVVYVEGLVKNGTTTAGTALFTLPVGWRPNVQIMVPGFSSDGACPLEVSPATGIVAIGPIAAKATYLSLTFSFPADQ